MALGLFAACSFQPSSEPAGLLQAFGTYTSDRWLYEVAKPIYGLRNDVMRTVRTFAGDAGDRCAT